VDPEDRHGSSPLHLAAGQGNTEAMRLLLKHGADYEHQTLGGATALHVAASVGQIEALKVLTGGEPVRANLMAEDKAQSTPRDVANRTGHTEAVELLEGALTEYITYIHNQYMPQDKRAGLPALLGKWEGYENRTQLLALMHRTLAETKVKVEKMVAGAQSADRTTTEQLEDRSQGEASEGGDAGGVGAVPKKLKKKKKKKKMKTATTK